MFPEKLDEIAMNDITNYIFKVLRGDSSRGDNKVAQMGVLHDDIKNEYIDSKTELYTIKQWLEWYDLNNPEQEKKAREDIDRANEIMNMLFDVQSTKIKMFFTEVSEGGGFEGGEKSESGSRWNLPGTFSGMSSAPTMQGISKGIPPKQQDISYEAQSNLSEPIKILVKSLIDAGILPQQSTYTQ